MHLTTVKTLVDTEGKYALKTNDEGAEQLMPRLLPAVFGNVRHVVDDRAPAHNSAHVGVRYSGLCGELCM